MFCRNYTQRVQLENKNSVTEAFLVLIRGKRTHHIQNKIKILRVHDWGRSMRNQKVIISAPSP